MLFGFFKLLGVQTRILYMLINAGTFAGADSFRRDGERATHSFECSLEIENCRRVKTL